MCRFIETICITDGEIRNLSLHQQRLSATTRRFWPDAEPLSLSSVLAGRPLLPGVVKARVLYHRNSLLSVSYTPYRPQDIRSLRLVFCDTITYDFKSADRSCLTDLRSRAQLLPGEEILIVRNGLLTDTSYSNVALYDGHEWHTPAQPLLRGTMRQSLLLRRIIKERDIPAEEYLSYHKVSLINAMLPLGALVVSLRP